VPNPKAVGERSEGIVLAELLRLGRVVLLPFGNNQRYDLVVDEGYGQFVRVQVKTAWWERGSICFKVNSVNAFTGKRNGYAGAADVFMIYSAITNQVYRVPVEECGTSAAQLRVDPLPPKSRRSVRWAADYELRKYYDNAEGVRSTIQGS
jgi:hypothetical protein